MANKNKEEVHGKIPVDFENLTESVIKNMIDKEKCLKEAVSVFQKTFVDIVLGTVDGNIERATCFLKVDCTDLDRIVNFTEE